VADTQAIADASGDYLTLRFQRHHASGTYRVFLLELDGGSFYLDAFYTISNGVIYYLKIDRDEAIGSYGQIRSRIYTDEARTTLVNTQTIALNSSKKDYRYIYAAQTNNAGAPGAPVTAFAENMDLQEVTGVGIPLAMYHYQHNTGSSL
jgi:hypothetical protein